MPPLFYYKTHIMRINAVSTLLCSIAIILFLGIIGEALYVNASPYIVFVLIAMILVCVGWIIFNGKKIKQITTCSQAYCIQLQNLTMENIIFAFNASRVEAEGYFCSTHINKYSSRILIQHCDVFCRDSVSHQRKKLNKRINSTHKSKSMVSLFDALSFVRINIVVCENYSDELKNYIDKNMCNLLSRNEIVLPIAVVLDTNQLLIPDCAGSVTLNQLDRYVSAVHFVCDVLSDLPAVVKGTQNLPPQ